MILLFYSDKCELFKGIITLLNQFNIQDKFNLIDIHKISKIPKNITVVPTIIEPALKALIEGKDVYHFIINQKFFFHPTNNIELWTNNQIPKPSIVEDDRAYGKKSINYYDLNNDKVNTIPKNEYDSFDILNDSQPSNKINNVTNSEASANQMNNNLTNIITEQSPLVTKQKLALLRLRR